MAASSSSKVATLANIFQSQDQANLDSSYGRDQKSGEKSGKRGGGSESQSQPRCPSKTDNLMFKSFTILHVICLRYLLLVS